MRAWDEDDKLKLDVRVDSNWAALQGSRRVEE